MENADLFTTLGAVVGSGVIGSLLRGWWTARKDKRDDAADSANNRAGIDMLERAQKERDAAETELAAERKERLSAERALTGAVADLRDKQRELVSAQRDIAMLRKKLKKAGVPDSDYVPLLETQFGEPD